MIVRGCISNAKQKTRFAVSPNLYILNSEFAVINYGHVSSSTLEIEKKSMHCSDHKFYAYKFYLVQVQSGKIFQITKTDQSQSMLF